MTADRDRALVVDDEDAIQRLVAGELTKHGFVCDLASEGDQAVKMVEKNTYRVVVADLRMPGLNGHALAQQILQRPNRPCVVIHTGIADPRLAKDLMARGVDDILFKPVDVGFLAMKVRTLVDRANGATANRAGGGISSAELLSKKAASDSLRDDCPNRPVSLARLNAKMNEISRVLPISEAALDVYNMTRSSDWSLPQIAAAIQRDASLSAEVLRLGNSSLYNTTERRIKDLTEAVSRIGQQRVAELALTSSALASLSPAMLPWMDLNLTWKRSMAAGIALEMLIEAGGHSLHDDGLLLSAIMHPLGRVAFGALFPKHYESMVERCNETNETLQEQERRIFPANHAEMAAQLLAAWQIPDEVILPLKYSCDDFTSVAQLSEPLRMRSELVKLAIVIGQLSVGKWQSWDTVQLPSPALINRLGIRKLSNIVRDTRADVDKLVGFSSDGSPAEPSEEPCEVEYTVAYCNIKGDENDLLPEFLRSMGIETEDYPAAELRELKVPAIVNCLGTAATRFVARRNKHQNLAFVDSERREVFSRFGCVAAIPSSFGSLREAVIAFLDRDEDNAMAAELIVESNSQGEIGEAETTESAIGEN